MVDVDAVLESARLKNEKVREYVRYWAEVTGADNIEVVSAADDARLIQEALDASEILPAGEGLYYSRSYYKDTARSEERTIVATNNPADKGVYNNWYPAAEMKEKLTGLMRGASAGKTMYVIPYLMSPPGSPLEKYAAGVQLTDNRSVVLHMNRMARVHVDFIDNLHDPASGYANAELVQRLLGNATLLTVASCGHPSYALPSTCVDKWRVRYLVNLVTPPPGTVCRTQIPFSRPALNHNKH